MSIPSSTGTFPAFRELHRRLGAVDEDEVVAVAGMGGSVETM